MVTTTTRTPSIVHDNSLTIDLRHRPTRAELGLPPGQSFRSYQHTEGPLRVTVELSRATVTIPAFVVLASTNAADGAGDVVASHEPKFFNIERRFPNGAAARRSLESDASALGLKESELARAVPEIGTGATIPQSRVLHGLVHGWLSLEITLTDLDAGAVQADYEFSIDVFHNPAVDRVVHNGVFTIDLRHRPTRRQLGFLPTYWDADVRPAWQRSLRVVLKLPTGRIDMAVSNVLSTSGIGNAPDPSGIEPPKMTIVSLDATSLTGARQRLLTDAATLGLDRNAIAAVFHGASGREVRKTLPGTQTAVYTMTATVEVKFGEPGAFAASLSYRFTYR
jgi:hypothetical protein